MDQAIGFPDIEQWACDYVRTLTDLPDNTYIGNTIPNPRKATMVVFRRDGGPRADLFRDQPRLTLMVWAPKADAATDLINLVRAHIWAAVGVGPIRKVGEFGGPNRIPDDSGVEIRQMTFVLTVKGAAL